MAIHKYDLCLVDLRNKCYVQDKRCKYILIINSAVESEKHALYLQVLRLKDEVCSRITCSFHCAFNLYTSEKKDVKMNLKNLQERDDK